MPFLIDLSADGGGFISQSVPMLRNQADQGARPGEQSLSPDDLWRRSVESWHHGAGQTHADRETSDPYRFRSSIHCDPWTKSKLQPLNTIAETAGATTYSTLLVAGDTLFWQKDTALQYATVVVDGVPTFSSATGLPATIYSAASDGANVYTVHGSANDLYVTDPATGVGASLVTNGGTKDLRLVRYAKGRILAFDTTGSVYNPVTAGALPTALYTHPLGADFVWTDATEGESNIYMSGYSGTGSEAHGVIYRTAIKADGTALDIPIIAARLPDGEQALAVCGYLGLLFIGTSLGVRTCLERDDGSLVVGPLIETGPCYCFEPQGSQVWFGWDVFEDFQVQNIDGIGTCAGLGRIDLTDFEFGKGAPPYATDLMREQTLVATTLSVITFQGSRFFVIAGVGLLGETTPAHDTFYMVSGLFNFGLTEMKTWHYLKTRSGSNTAGTVIPYVNSTDVLARPGDGLARTNLVLSSSENGTDDDPLATSTPTTFDISGRRSEELEYMLQLFEPTTRVTLFGRPAVASRSEIITATVMLYETMDAQGADVDLNVAQRLQKIRALIRSAAPVDLNDGTETYKVTLEDYRYIRMARSENVIGRWNGPCQLQMKRNDTITPVFRACNDDAGTASSFSVDTPAGCLSGDLLFAAITWTGASGVPTGLDTGWTLLDSHVGDTNFKSATYWRTGEFAAFAGTFGVSTSYAAAIVAYSQGDTIVAGSSAHDTASGLDYLSFLDLSVNGLAAIAVTVCSVTSGVDPLLVGVLRPRCRVMVDGGARDLYLEIGDAVSVSDFKANETNALSLGCDVGDLLDAAAAYVKYTDEVRVYYNTLK